MTQPKVGEDAYLDEQAHIYRQLGQALFETLDADQQQSWQRIALQVQQPSSGDGNAHSYRVTLTLADGLELPLVARPETIDLCRRLDLLARNRFGGERWTEFAYELLRGSGTPSYDCRYIYANTVH